MSTVLDASAILAILYDEPGSEVVEAVLPTAVICAANVGEVAERLRRDFEAAAVRASLEAILPLTIPADKDLAIAAGLLAPLTRTAGLSLGDRFCLALAARMRAPAMTADRAWHRIASATGVEVQLIR